MYDILNIYSRFAHYSTFGIEDFDIPKEKDQLFLEALDQCSATHKYDPSFERNVPMWTKGAEGIEIVSRYYDLKKHAE